MRACTATLIELRFNPALGRAKGAGGDADPYAAAVEFVSKEEWGRELDLMYAALEEGGWGVDAGEAPKDGTPAHLA
eukprot:2146280-Pyramimonas_sp.AAC.1